MFRKKHEPSLEERLILEAESELANVRSSFYALLNAHYIITSMDEELFTPFNQMMRYIGEGIFNTGHDLQKLKEVYASRQVIAPSKLINYLANILRSAWPFLIETSEKSEAGGVKSGGNGGKSIEGVLIHDANNSLVPIIGYPELLLTNKTYNDVLGQHYLNFKDNLESIGAGAERIRDVLSNLGGFYHAKEQKVDLVEASVLGQEEITYTVIHVDDDPTATHQLDDALSTMSNVLPPLPGYFGHSGRKVSYRVHSFSSVAEALKAIKGLQIDLLITDREMPEQDGYALLNALNQPKKPKQRRAEFANVRNIAMLTGGITQQDETRTRNTYGIPIFTKPIQPLQLEQQVYNAINRNK